MPSTHHLVFAQHQSRLIQTKVLVMISQSRHGVTTYVRRAATTTTLVLSAIIVVVVGLLAITAISPIYTTYTVTNTFTSIGTSTQTETLTFQTNYTSTSTVSAQPVTNTVTATSIQTTAVISFRNNTVTTTVLSTMSFSYLTASGTVCMAGEAYAPCWGGNDPYVFNCLSTATTQQGCTQQVVDTTPPNGSYMINVRYLFNNQTQPSWSNCLWSIQGEMPGQGYGYCSVVGSNSFIIGEPAPALSSYAEIG